MDTGQVELLKAITAFLETHHIPYMITGAWSAIFYGRPRASHDIDFVVEIHKQDIRQVIEAFRKLPNEFLVQADQIKSAVLKKSMFNILHLPSVLKLDFWVLSDDEFNRSRFVRKRKEKILEQYMYIASPEDTILGKLMWYKKGRIEKHLIDAAFVYQIQKANLDKAYLKSWAKKKKITQLLEKLGKIDLEQYY